VLRIFFFHAGTAAKWDEDGGRLLLGDNTGRGGVTLRPISFQCVRVWILTLILLTWRTGWAHNNARK